MAKISIIIAAYNVERYIQECIDSVRKQTLQDIDIVIVDDASTDTTPAILAQAAHADERIRVITHTVNQGLHITRKTGVAAASGEYAFFLDGDDDLEPTMCEELYRNISESPVDILHFGLSVIGENGILDDERIAFERFNNAPVSNLNGPDIVHSIYLESSGHTVDWRITQRLIRTSLLRKAFDQMSGHRLERAEDGYECLVVSSMADSYRSAKQLRGYRYHYGRGVTGTSTITPEKFGTFCRQFNECYHAASEFAVAHPELELNECATGFRHKATELLANDWMLRVDATGKSEAAHLMSEVFGDAITAREIYRFVRDRSYSFIASGDLPKRDAPLFHWMHIADSLTDTDVDRYDARRCMLMKRTAADHVAQLQADLALRDAADQPIRIFVTTHKQVDKPESSILQLVQVGPGNRTNRFSGTFHDDEGDNISDKNPMYCELTTQYWAWKNVDAEYYGFCHYRRYFDFSETEHEENPYGEIMDDYIDNAAVLRYGLDDDTIRHSVEGYDVITTGIKDLSTVIDGLGTPRKIWEAAPKLVDDDLRNMYRILCTRHPDYKPDAEAFMNGNHSCFCNMFIMRKEIFFDYCAWLFPLLEEFERNTDMSRYSKEALRTPGHLSERLLNIYLMHHKRVGTNWRTKELQCVHFTNPEPKNELQPLFEVEDPQCIVPVVFAADNNYVPELTTTIYSAMKNASQDRHYDVTVLTRDIAGEHQETMRRFFARFSNMTLRFADVDREVSGFDLTTNNAHISIETYYRFLIQQVLPFYNKVLYLDSDIVINGDIAQLYDTELGDNLLAACHDIDYLGNLNVKHGNKRMAYTKNVLHMKDPYAYFQAGVLVLNTAAMRELHTIGQWLAYASDSSLIYNDQDVLNIRCEGRVTYLDWNWNVVHDCANRVANVFSFAPNDTFDAYMASRKDPKIIHYAGFEKPWRKPNCDFADVYWSYARETPFHEWLLGEVAKAQIPALAPVVEYKPPRAIGENNALRAIVDPLMPIGSRRREVIKSFGRALRGR